MATFHKRRENQTSMQTIEPIETKIRLQDQIMQLMRERMRAREQRTSLNQEKVRLKGKIIINARLNTHLDSRIDKLMEQYTK